MSEVSGRLTNVLLGVLFLGLALHPSGPLGGYISERIDTFRLHQRINENWPRATTVATNLAGPTTEPILLEVVDYQCPYCRVSSSVLTEFAASSAVSIGILQYPLPAHTHAELGARYALCADKQGVFPHAHEYLMSTSEWMTQLQPDQVAVDLKIPDAPAFRQCVAGEAVTRVLASHREIVASVKVEATPALVTPSQIAYGSFSREDLDGLVMDSSKDN